MLGPVVNQVVTLEGKALQRRPASTTVGALQLDVPASVVARVLEITRLITTVLLAILLVHLLVVIVEPTYRY